MQNSPTFAFAPAKIAIPNGVREAMLQQNHQKALLLVEGLYHLKVAPEGWFTFQQIYNLLANNFGMSERLVREGLRDAQVFQRRKSQPQPGQRGAPPHLHRVPTLLELIATFAPQAENTPSDSLIKSDLKNVTAYKMALYHLSIARNWCENGGKGVTTYRAFQADRLNISIRTLRTYDKLLGHTVEANYKETQITGYDLHKLPRYKDKYGSDGKRLPSRRWLRVVEQREGLKIVTNYPLVHYLAWDALRQEKQVYVVERLANTYYPFTLPDVAGLGQVDGYFAKRSAARAAGFQERGDAWKYQRA